MKGYPKIAKFTMSRFSYQYAKIELRSRRCRQIQDFLLNSMAKTRFRSLSTTTQGEESFWTLSFSGAGHLLSYHLGVANVLLSRSSPQTTSQTRERRDSFRLPIQSISGSSSGAIAATITALLPHRLEEYTDRYLQDRGHAFRNLKKMLTEEEQRQIPSLWSDQRFPTLSICTTRCSDGSCYLFTFRSPPKSHEHEYLFSTIEASCKIPRSFHPFDMLFPSHHHIFENLYTKGNSVPSVGRHTYSIEEGVEIDGNGFVDGGIVAPFPPTTLDTDSNCIGRIAVSPIAGDYFYNKKPLCQTTGEQPRLEVIRPCDVSRKLPLLQSVTLSGDCSATSYVKTEDENERILNHIPIVAVRARPSMQNFRAMTTALGIVPEGTSAGNRSGILHEWYKRGQEDAFEVVLEIEKCIRYEM